MKVDIETGEYDLFASMDDSDLSMIDNILMEYHIIGGRTYEKDATLILNQLKTAGFNCTTQSLHAQGGFIFATKSEVKIDDRNNLTRIDSYKLTSDSAIITVENYIERKSLVKTNV